MEEVIKKEAIGLEVANALKDAICYCNGDKTVKLTPIRQGLAEWKKLAEEVENGQRN
jgi:hypothetical protein